MESNYKVETKENDVENKEGNAENGENDGLSNFSRNSHERSSVKDLRKKFEAKSKLHANKASMKTSEICENTKIKTNIEIIITPNTPVTNKLVHRVKCPKSSSTPRKPNKEENLLPNEINISDVKMPVSPIESNSNVAPELSGFSRNDSCRSSVKLLRKRFEFGKSGSENVSNEACTSADTNVDSSIQENQTTISRELSSIANNSPGASGKSE